MISVIVYGRNDSYGYNLHKRAALSLNNFGELLSDPSDEIIFVDYNTPSGYPSFPEAILDTLTPKTRALLRVIKVSEADHYSLGKKTHLRTLEPVARNVALRRSEPKNRWILSTNTDMIFVPHGSETLSDIVAGLDDGQYGLPRFELPEGLWEGFPRQRPREVINNLRRIGWDYHLNQVAESHWPHQFDAPGDFQLMLRSDLFDIDGFDERMTRGWHVDSNISKRISFMRGQAESLSGALFGYHCDHTRQETPMHAPGATQNSITQFINAVSQPDIPSQRTSWGLPLTKLSDFTFNSHKQNSFQQALQRLGIPAQQVLEFRRYNSLGFDKDPPDDYAVVPFLLDLILSAGPDEEVFWLGRAGKLRDTVAHALSGSEFKFNDVTEISRPSLVAANLLKGRYRKWLVIDFRLRFDESQISAPKFLRKIASLLFFLSWQISFSGRADRRPDVKIVGIDVTNTIAEPTFNTFVRSARTPYIIGFRHGTLEPITIGFIPRAVKAILRLFARIIKARLFPDYSLLGFITRRTGLRFASQAYSKKYNWWR